MVVVTTIARVTMKAAAAAKTGRQRAAIHNRTGNSSAIGTTVVQRSCGNAMTMMLMTMSGAIVTMPSASDANQFCQVTKIDAVVLWNTVNPSVPPIPETAVATIAAPT